MPQWIRLDFRKPVKVREVRLTFDTDLTPRRVALYPKQLVKAYVIEGLVNGEWVSLAVESENRLRHRVQRIPESTLESLRVLVTSTWGDPSARIFEIRAY